MDGLSKQECCYVHQWCPCCEGHCEPKGNPCEVCAQAVGFHRCKPEDLATPLFWRPGSLHSGKVDVVSALWSLAKRHVPLQVLRDKLQEYINAGHLDLSEREELEPVLEQMNEVHREENLFRDDARASAAVLDEDNRQMTEEELRAELTRR